MKNRNKSLIGVFIFLITPFLALVSFANAQATENSIIGGGVLGTPKAWDPAITQADVMNPIKGAAIQSLGWQDTKGRIHPLLAESWTIHERPDEESAAGMNYGGVEAITFNLREGVLFHDGSELTAEVVKWNFEREIYISGYVDNQWATIHWFKPASYANRFTASWNLTWAIDNPISDTYGIPFINRTEIISDYVVKVWLNKWYTSLVYFGWLELISMESYEPWSETPIYGYEDVPDAPDGTPFPGHMIGTGAYEFESVDFLVESKAHSTRFANYWNKTALRADGYFSITDLYIRFFADYDSRSSALLATDIDYVGYMLQTPAPVADIKNGTDFDFIPTVPDASVNVVAFVTEEGLDTVVSSLGTTIRDWFPTSTVATADPPSGLGLPSGTELPTGVNLTVRKALSYAYDYNGFMAAVYPEDGAGGIYCWSPFGMSSQFTDETEVDHPGPDPDLAEGRSILFADPYYAAILADKGLTLTSTDTEWNTVAETDPIYTYKLLGYPGMLTADFITEACNNLGFAVDVHEDAAEPGELWTKFVATGRAVMYDMFSYVFLMEPQNPAQYGPYWYSSGARRLPYFWGYNYAHLSNAEVDNIFSNIEFLEDKFDSYNRLADILINEAVPALYESQGNMGIIIASGYSRSPIAHEFGGVAGPGISISHLGDSRTGAITPPIPGFPTAFVLLTMVASMIGIIFSIKRKRK